MNKENREVVKAHIDEAAERLQGRLPISDRHPQGRNPHAHIARVIKYACGASYTVLPDEDLSVVLHIIEHCERHPF